MFLAIEGDHVAGSSNLFHHLIKKYIIALTVRTNSTSFGPEYANLGSEEKLIFLRFAIGNEDSLFSLLVLLVITSLSLLPLV